MANPTPSLFFDRARLPARGADRAGPDAHLDAVVAVAVVVTVVAVAVEQVLRYVVITKPTIAAS